MKIILVYEIVPEDLKFYIFDQLSLEDTRRLVNCHNKYINSEDEWPESEWLSTFLEDKKPICLDESIELDGKYRVVITGMIL